MDALLIINMQVGSFTSAPRMDAQNVISRINRLSEAFREQNRPVVFIRHDGTRENFLIHGSPDWEVLPDLIQDKRDKWIEKTATPLRTGPRSRPRRSLNFTTGFGRI